MDKFLIRTKSTRKPKLIEDSVNSRRNSQSENASEIQGLMNEGEAINSGQDMTDKQFQMPISTTKEAEDLGSKNDGPRQPLLFSFPTHKIGDHNRSFQADWYNNYTFIEYSVQRDSAFCFPCRIFSTGQGNAEKAFTHNGVNDWKKFREKLTNYVSSSEHISCCEKWALFRYSTISGPITSQLSNAHLKAVEENKIYVAKLVDIIKFLSKQGLAFRGHIETSDSTNEGNFRELCKLFGQFDIKFNEQLLKTYNLISANIQNELINIISTLMTEKIQNEVVNVGFYSLIADEAKSHKSELLAISIRYCRVIC